MAVKFGVDVLVSQAHKYGNIGLVTNDMAFTSTGVLVRVALLDAGFTIKKLFTPEHGITGQGADGAVIHDGVDSLTNLPIISLYGDKLAPSFLDLEDIDTVFFDVPDVGLRYYTYLWTLSHVLETCAALNKKLVILDRPNPLSGTVNGPGLDEKHCSSFIGRWNIPVRHGCTLGELAQFFNKERYIGADLEIIPCQNWKRYMVFTDWQLPFKPTSPAIPAWESLLAYPISVFLEATNLSDGRGTDSPFALIGAPWLQPLDISNWINISEGITIQEVKAFTPKDGKYKNVSCSGIQIRVTDVINYKPFVIGVCLLKSIKEQNLLNFEWMPYPTAANPTGENHLDLLTGIHNSEQLLNKPWDEFIQILTQPLSGWEERMEQYKLYD